MITDFSAFQEFMNRDLNSKSQAIFWGFETIMRVLWTKCLFPPSINVYVEV